MSEEVEEDWRLRQLLGVERLHLRHLEDLLQQIVLVFAQVVDKVLVVVAYYGSQHSGQLELSNLDPSFGKRIPDYALPDRKLVQVYMLVENCLVIALLAAFEVWTNSKHVGCVNVYDRQWCFGEPFCVLLLQADVAVHPENL